MTPRSCVTRRFYNTIRRLYTTKLSMAEFLNMVSQQRYSTYLSACLSYYTAVNFYQHEAKSRVSVSTSATDSSYPPFSSFIDDQRGYNGTFGPTASYCYDLIRSAHGDLVYVLDAYLGTVVGRIMASDHHYKIPRNLFMVDSKTKSMFCIMLCNFFLFFF